MVAVRGAALVAALAVALALPGVAAAQNPPGCGPAGVPGGEWRSYGHDYSNTRHQDRERVISPADVPLLSPAWTFSTAEGGGEGDITGTPVVADGCAYVATNGGWVFALNADTGDVVWKTQVPYGGGVNSSVTVDGGRAYVDVNRTQQSEGCPAGDPCIGPYAIALDQGTGELVWASPSLDQQMGADAYSSPVVFEDTLLIGVSGGEALIGTSEEDRYRFQGSLVFVDASNGDVLRKTWTIRAPDTPDDEFSGAGVWSTPAIDPEAKLAYAGTANPYQPQGEHKYANAVLKYDVDRASPTFGEILGHYEGTPDEYLDAFADMPCVDFPGNVPPYPSGLGSCGDLDLDFGSSPHLFVDESGRKRIGVGQKSGVFHVIDAETMEPVWTQVVGPPSSVGGVLGSTAYDGESFFGPITVPGYLWSLSAAEGRQRWVAPVADGLHWGPPVAVANGVVYTVGFTGFLDAYDARTGALLAKRPLALGGTSSGASLSWGGVSVARNTIYAAVGMTGLEEGFVVAFRPGGTTDVAGDVEKTVEDLTGGGGDDPGPAPAGAAIVAGPGTASVGYATPVMTTQVGGPLNFANLDVVQHDVTAEDLGTDGRPLFRTPLIGIAQTVPVEGLDQVQAGQTYGFYCTLHPGMRGSLIVR